MQTQLPGIAGSGITNIEYLVPVSLVRPQRRHLLPLKSRLWKAGAELAQMLPATVSWGILTLTVYQTIPILSHVYNGTSDVTNYYVTDTNGL